MAMLTHQAVGIDLPASDWLIILGWISGQSSMDSLPSPVMRLAEAINENVDH